MFAAELTFVVLWQTLTSYGNESTAVVDRVDAILLENIETEEDADSQSRKEESSRGDEDATSQSSFSRAGGTGEEVKVGAPAAYANVIDRELPQEMLQSAVDLVARECRYALTLLPLVLWLVGEHNELRELNEVHTDGWALLMLRPLYCWVVARATDILIAGLLRRWFQPFIMRSLPVVLLVDASIGWPVSLVVCAALHVRACDGGRRGCLALPASAAALVDGHDVVAYDRRHLPRHPGGRAVL